MQPNLELLGKFHKLSSLSKNVHATRFLLLVVILALFGGRIALNPLPRFDYQAYEHMYSELVAGRSLMSDSDIYAFAGWSYVHGLSPDKLNFEHPPLAKYLIGFSELMFGNQDVLGIVFGGLTLITVYLISRKLLPGYYAVLPSAFLALDRLFLTFSATSTLDIYMVFFVSLYLLVFLQFINRRWIWIALGLVLGFAVATKWPAIAAFPPLVVYAILKKDHRALRMLLLSLPLAFLAYSSTYIVFFLNGHSINDFVGLQLQILNFQQHYRLGRGTPPPLWLLFNFLTGIEGPDTFTHIVVNWTARTLDTTSVQYGYSTLGVYNPFTWPLSFSASILTIGYGWKSQYRMTLVPALAFFSFLGLFSSGQVFIWYILPALPFAFISLAYMLWRIASTAKTPWKAQVLIGVYLVAVGIWSYFLTLPYFIATS